MLYTYIMLKKLNKEKKKKIPYLIAFILKCVGQTMRDSEDPGAPLPPPSDVLQSARLVRLPWMAGSASRRRPSSQPSHTS